MKNNNFLYRHLNLWFVISIILFFLLFFLIVLPQIRIVIESFNSNGNFTLNNFVHFFTIPRFYNAAFNSLWIAIVSGSLALLISVPGAYILAHYNLPGRNAFLTAATMATVSPPFLGAYAWVMLLGRGGMITKAFKYLGIPLPFETIIGAGGIIWVSVWGTQALVFLLAYDAFRYSDPSLDEASSSVGASPWRTRFRIVIPLAIPSLITGFYMSSIKIFTDFGTPLIIGGGKPILSTTIYYEFLSEVSSDPTIASTGSLVMLGIACIALAIQQWVLKRKNYATLNSRRMIFKPISGLKKIFAISYLVLIFAICFVPHLIVLMTSFLTWRVGILRWIPTLDNYKQLFNENLSVIIVSFLLAGIAIIFCIIVALLVAYLTVKKRFAIIVPLVNTMTMIPYVIPGTVLAIGLILTFGSKPFVLTGTATILIIAFFIRRIPYVTKSLEASLTQIHPALEEAAISVGAKPMRAFAQITTPLIKPSIISGGTVGFLQMITELSATIMLYSVPFITMTVVIFTNAMQPSSPFGVASAMTVIMMVSVYIPLYWVRKKFA